MEEKEKKEEEISTKDKTDEIKENELKTEETEESKEPTLEDKYKELEEKYNSLLKEKIDKDREIRHSESYKKYDLSKENVNLLKRYLANKDDIEEELQILNKDFPHLFNTNKNTNISNSLDVKDKYKKDNNEIDNSKLGMVG